MPIRRVSDPDKLQRLIRAALLIESDLRLPLLLRRLAEEASALVDARYGALGVLNESQTGLEQFITVGLDEETERRIGARPTGQGLLGLLILDAMPIRLADMTAHADSFGVPSGHPPMKTFLGVPVRVRDEVYGNLYLTEKRGGGEFTEEDESLVAMLAVSAGIAIEHARLQERVRLLALVEDRDRLARELHDNVIQRLFAIGLALQGTAQLDSRREIANRVERAVGDIDETIRQLRTAIFDLGRAPDVEDFRHQVLNLARELEPVVGTTPEVTMEGPIDTGVNDEVAVHALAVLRELLTNVGKHAHATTVRVSLELSGAGELCLKVRDNGRGLTKTATFGQEEARGLKNLSRRAEKLGGTFAVESSPGAGTVVVWRVPAAAELA